MSRARTQALADAINSFWRERGFDAGAEVVIERGGREVEGTHALKTKLVNGLPPNFTSARGRVANVETVPLRRLKFGGAQ